MTSAAAPLQNVAAKPQTSSNATGAGLLLQRQCACGSSTTSLTASLTGQCAACASKKFLQPKQMIGASNDPLEWEADRIADQVLAAPLHPAVSGARPRIQRFTGQSTGQTDTAPASVDRVLASSGRPLDAALQQDMEQRFGHDFSRVRVHSGTAVEQSARDVNASAYTVGHNIVFGAGQFAPGTHEGRRLIAHELTHVVQQSYSDGIRVGQSNGEGGLFVSTQAAQATASGRQGVTVNGTTSAYLARAPLTTAASGAAVGQTRAPGIQRIFRPELSLGEVMGIIESIRPSESASGIYTLVRDREVLTITQDEYNKIRASAQKILLDGLRKVRRKTEDAQLQYDAQHKIDEDQWIVSGTVRFFGGIDDPGGSIRQNVRFATFNAEAAQVFIERGQLVRGAEFFAKSEMFATSAKKSSQAYVDNLISTAETTATVLEVTAVVAGATVVVIAAILAAPAVIAAAPAVIAAARAAPLVVALGTGAVPAAPVVAVEVAALTAPAAIAVAAPAAIAVAAPAAIAVAAPAAVAASTLSTAALAAAGIAVASTTLSSDSPKPADAEKEKKEKKKDACLDLLNLRPGINDRWHRQRGPIAGHTTVASVAFRLDRGINPPAGQITTPRSRDWVHAIGLPKDDAGHVIGNRFGGRADFNSQNGNIFPQDLSFNRGAMVMYDTVIAELHQRGCDVCTHISLIYDSPTGLRPSSALYTYLYRSFGASGFNPPISAQVPNP